MEDQYIITVLGEYICYFKNDKLHREAGPAAYFLEDKQKYLDLEDKDLYKQGTPPNSRVNLIFIEYDLKLANVGKDRNSPLYYFEGENYEKQAFDTIIENKKIRNELTTELLVTPSQTKKAKI